MQSSNDEPQRNERIMSKTIIEDYKNKGKNRNRDNKNETILNEKNNSDQSNVNGSVTKLNKLMGSMKI